MKKVITDATSQMAEILTPDETATAVALINELKAQIKDLESQVEALSDRVKKTMDNDGVDSMIIGDYSVKYTRFFSERFDSKAFKADDEITYLKYTKIMPSSRFTVNKKESA